MPRQLSCMRPGLRLWMQRNGGSTGTVPVCFSVAGVFGHWNVGYVTLPIGSIDLDLMICADCEYIHSLMLMSNSIEAGDFMARQLKHPR